VDRAITGSQENRSSEGKSESAAMHFPAEIEPATRLGEKRGQGEKK